MSRPLRVLFVTDRDFSTPSEMHVLGFAEGLAARGHRALISLGGDPASAAREGFELAAGIEVHRHEFRGPFLTRETIRRARAFDPDVVHAWTPRVPIMPAARQYARATGAPWVVHFDDDEWRPWPHASRDLRTRLGRARRRVGWPLHPPVWGMATRRTLRWAARDAAAVDALSPALAREVAARLGRSCTLLFPPMPALRHFDAGEAVRLREADERVVLFSGRVIPTSLPDFTCAIDAVAELRRRGLDARLVQTGAIGVAFDVAEFAARRGLDANGLSLLGHIRFVDVLPTLRTADVLIQPGPPSRFNQLRLPSKLQLYLASSTPTISFAIGVEEFLVDGQDVLMTQTGEPAELADRLYEVLTDAGLRARLSAGGPAAFARLFDTTRTTAALLELYRDVLGATSSR